MIKTIFRLSIDVLEEHTILRYIISGGISAFVNISLFSFFYYIFNFHYLFSNVIAFIVAFFISLSLQKFWTFKDRSMENIHVQGFLYLLNSIFGLGLNTLILYVCVDYFGIMPIVGVIIAGALTAICTFQITSRFVFKKD